MFDKASIRQYVLDHPGKKVSDRVDDLREYIELTARALAVLLTVVFMLFLVNREILDAISVATFSALAFAVSSSLRTVATKAVYRQAIAAIDELIAAQKNELKLRESLDRLTRKEYPCED